MSWDGVKKGFKIFGFGLKVFLFFLAIILFLILGVKLYPLFRTCWTCDVFESIYDTLSLVSSKTFYYFQDYVLVLVSVGFALWIVYTTFIAFQPALVSMLFPDKPPDIGFNFVKTIYKKIFLIIAVVGMVIINEPRNVLSNTFEITLDFGTSIARQILYYRHRDKANYKKSDDIPEYCFKGSGKLIYKSDDKDDGHYIYSLSDTTKHNVICLMHDINSLRSEYVELGIALFNGGQGALKWTLVGAVSAKLAMLGIGVAFKVVSKNLANKAGDWLKVADKQGKEIAAKTASKTAKQNYLDVLKKSLTTATGAEKDSILKTIDRYEKSIKNLTDDIGSLTKGKTIVENFAKNTRDTVKITKKISKGAVNLNGALEKTVLIGSFLKSESTRMGFAGILILLGFFFLNMFFSFVIIEFMLFVGMSIILLPVIGACYIFEFTRQFATASLKLTLSFSLKLIFSCIAMVICYELNAWILGGMFTGAKEPINFYKAKELVEAGTFYDAVGSTWFVLYALLAVAISMIVMQEIGKFAKWFGADIADTSMANGLIKMGKTVKGAFMSTGRSIRKTSFKKITD